PRPRWNASIRAIIADGALTLRNPTETLLVDCCARAASGQAAAPPSAASNSRRPMVTVIRPSRARCVKETIPRHERAVPNSAPPGEGAAHAGQQAATERRFARSLRLDFERFIFGRAASLPPGPAG